MTFSRFTIYFFSLFTFYTFSQSQISGKIIDTDNSIALETVEIKNIKTGKQTLSDQNGFFEVSEAGTYTIVKKGYSIKTIKLKTGKYYIIQLKLNPDQLGEVIVNSNHIPKKLKQATSPIEIISNKDIERSNNINPVSVLNRTPGVFMQTGALNTNRITIRGIGSRNLFGTSKIRAYFKDIPLTNGNGETTIEDFELGAIGRIEVTKGATSSIYGAGLGGTIQLIPKSANFSAQNLSTEFTLGSFGLVKNLTSINLHSKKSNFNGVYSNTHSNGYRDNNTYSRQTFTLHSNHYVTQRDELSVLASYVDLKAFIPSSLNEDNYLNNPTSAAFTWNNAMGFEDTQRGIFGLSWNHQYSNKLKQVTSMFSSFREGYEPRPFNILSENVWAYGVRSRLIGRSKLFNKSLTWTLGGELFKDIYKYKTFENLYEDFPPNTGSIKGNELSNFKENRSYYNVFLEANHNLTINTILSLGLNMNTTSYKLTDNFMVSTNNPDQSGEFKFKTILSPKLGISHYFNKNIGLIANISHGFSPISLEETLLPDGQINLNLKPETGWNYELGLRGNLNKNKLQYQLSLYRLSLKNLLVARRVNEDQFIGINAGKTQHDGLEATILLSILKSEELHISTTANASINNYSFKEFIDENNDFSGNDLTGVPSEVYNVILDIDSKIGLYGNINYQHIGNIPITDSNNLFSNSYNLANLRIGFKKNLNKKLKTNLFFGLNNIFDTKYASQILINASSFGGRAPRYYYPGNPVNYYSGINLNYEF